MDESLNRSSILQTLQTNRNEGQPQQPSIVHHSFEIALSNRNKVLLIVPVILVLLVISLAVGNQIKNNMMNDLDEVNSANNIFNFYKVCKI